MVKPEEQLRALVQDIRRKPVPISNIIPTLDAGATEIEALRARVAELEAALRYAGKHPEDCVAGEPGPCTSHMAYLEVEAELAALRAGPSAGGSRDG